MPYHSVQQGEHLSGIAQHHGFSDYTTIWDHPDNAPLRQQRDNPHVLLPGDRLFIPERDVHEEPAVTNQRHRFEVNRWPLWLRLDVSDLFDHDLRGMRCELHMGTERRELVIPANGVIETRISPALKNATLIIDQYIRQLKIGGLDPVDQPSGQRERLRNLGYFHVDVNDEDEPSFLADAIALFQSDHDLESTGVCGEQTKQKLLEIHGC